MSKHPRDPGREANIFKVLEAIRRGSKVTLSDVGELTGLATGTVSEAVTELEKRRFIQRRAQARKGRGRPLSTLQIEPDALLLGGFALQLGRLYFVIADASGETRFARDTPVQLDAKRSMVDILQPPMKQLLAARPRSLRQLDGLGISLPGTVDTERGLLYWGPESIKPTMPIAQLLSAKFKYPVFIENMAQARARAERMFGDGRDVSDFVVVGQTLGLGQYVRGELWTGPRGLNPEFRHFKMGVESTPRCDCGAYGCLGTLSGALGVMMQCCALVGVPLPPFSEVPRFLDEFLARAHAGDRRFEVIFQRAGTMLGIALANIINFYDPARVIVTVSNQGMLDAMSAHLRQALTTHVFPPGHLPDLRLKAEEHLNHARGAAALAFERVLRSAAVPHLHPSA